MFSDVMKIRCRSLGKGRERFWKGLFLMSFNRAFDGASLERMPKVATILRQLVADEFRSLIQKLEVNYFS